MSTHTPSCLEPLSTKIVERWSLNCWLIPRLCLNWTLTGREGQTAPCVNSRVNAQRRACPLTPSARASPAEVQAIKIKVLTVQHFVPGQDALADGAGRLCTGQSEEPLAALLTFTALQEFNRIVLLMLQLGIQRCPDQASLPAPVLVTSSAKGDAFCGGYESFWCKSWKGRLWQNSIYLCTCRTKACTS